MIIVKIFILSILIKNAQHNVNYVAHAEDKCVWYLPLANITWVVDLNAI